MPYSTILAEVRDGVGHLTLNRPEAANAISLTVAQELMDVTTAWVDDPAVRAVLLTGSGARFCAGGDLKSFAGRADLGRHLTAVTTYLHMAVVRLARMNAPVVVAVQGSAAGAGCSLACAGDLVLAADSAFFLMAYTDVGLTPDGSGTWFLPRLVGLRRAMDLTLTNRRLTAREAEEWGIVSRVVPDGELVAEAEELARSLASGPTQSLGAAKRLLRGSLGRDLEAQLELETQSLATAADSHDGQEGVAAFVEKRRPNFSGT